MAMTSMAILDPFYHVLFYLGSKVCPKPDDTVNCITQNTVHEFLALPWVRKHSDSQHEGADSEVVSYVDGVLIIR